MGCGTLLFWLVPRFLLGMFSPTEDLIALGIPALRILSVCYVFTGISIVFSSVFQALGEGMLSLIMSIVRQLLIVLPVAYVLAITFGLPAVWYALPASEILCTLLAIFFIKECIVRR